MFLRAHTYTTILTGLLLWAFPLAAQRVTAGVKAGISFPWLDTDLEQNDGYGSRQAFYYGAFINWKINRLYSIQAELNQSPQGGVRNGLQPLSPSDYNNHLTTAGNPIYANFSKTTELNYLEIPVLVKASLKTGRRFHYFVAAGPYLAALTRARTVSEGNSLLYADAEGRDPLTQPGGTALPAVSFNKTSDISGEIRRFNSGLIGATGFSMTLKQTTLALETRFTWGLTDIQKDSWWRGDHRTGSLIIAITYSTNL